MSSSPRVPVGRLVRLVVGGQFLSLLITGTGVFSQLLSERGVSLPTTQSFLNYFLLSFFLLPLVHRYKHRRVQHQLSGRDSDDRPRLLVTRWWVYALLAFLDVEGNALLVRAYHYTNITSIQLLDCFTVPLVMALSYCLLRTRFARGHYIGTLLCLSGVVTLIVSDLYIQSYNTDSDDAILGDFLVLLGCVCYAVSNLSQEHIVKKADAIEWLAMIGLFGTVISGVQMLVLEREALAALVLDSAIASYFIGFGACLYLLYLTVPILLSHSSAVFMNLSLLSSDFWSVLAGYLLFHLSLHVLYFVAFVLIVMGLVLYNLASMRTSMVFGDSDGDAASGNGGDVSEERLSITTSVNGDKRYYSDEALLKTESATSNINGSHLST